MAAATSQFTTFGALATGNQNLNLFDTEYGRLYAAVNSLNNFSNYYVDTGSANAYAITVPTTQTVTLSAGLRLQILPIATNSTASTLQITNGTSVQTKNIFFNGGACIGKEIIGGVPFDVIFDGTQFNIIGQASGRPSVVVFTASGTTITPANARRCKVYAKGPGGSGGSSSTTRGGGGGEGEERWGWFNVAPGSTITVTLGTGGTSVVQNTNVSGVTGGTTVVTDGTFTVAAKGGLGGTSGNSGGEGGPGASGGTGGDYAMPGAKGQAGSDSGGATIAIFSGGGGKGGGSFGAAGVANSGGGGGGGGTAAASGAGALGIAVVEFWP